MASLPPPTILATTTRDKLPPESLKDFKSNSAFKVQPITFSLCIRYTSSHAEVERWIAIEGGGLAASPYAPAAQPQVDPLNRRALLPSPMPPPTDSDIKQAKTTAIKIFDGSKLKRTIDISKIAAVYFDNSETVTIYVTGEEDLCVSFTGTQMEFAKKTKKEILQIQIEKQRRFLKVLIELMDPRIPVDFVANAKLKATALDKSKKDKGRTPVPLNDVPLPTKQQRREASPTSPVPPREDTAPLSPPSAAAPPPPLPQPPKSSPAVQSESLPPRTTNSADDRSSEELEANKKLKELHKQRLAKDKEECLALQREEEINRKMMIQEEKAELRQKFIELKESLRRSLTQQSATLEREVQEKKPEPPKQEEQNTKKFTTPAREVKKPRDPPLPSHTATSQSLSFEDELRRQRQGRMLEDQRRMQEGIQNEVDRRRTLLHPEDDEAGEAEDLDVNDGYNGSEIFSNPKITYGDLFESELYRPPLYGDPENEDPYYHLIMEIPKDIASQILKPLQIKCNVNTTPNDVLARHQEITDATTLKNEIDGTATALLLGGDVRVDGAFYLGKSNGGVVDAHVGKFDLSLEQRQFANKINHGKHYLSHESMQVLLTNNYGRGIAGTSRNSQPRQVYGAGRSSLNNSGSDRTLPQQNQKNKNTAVRAASIEETLELEASMGWSPHGNVMFDHRALNTESSNLGKVIEYITRRQRQKLEITPMYPTAHPLI